MGRVWILAANKVIDGEGSLSSCHTLERQLADLGLSARTLTIDPLATDWHSPLEADHFRSGCAPIEALDRARRLIIDGAQDAVVISGRDRLRSDYGRDERLARMAIYGDEYPLTQAYNDLADRFVARQGGARELFLDGARALFDNYTRTFLQRRGQDAALPGEAWHRPVTELFRGVDCANPVVDFEGRLLLCSDRARDALGWTAADAVSVAGVGLGLLAEDGPGAIDAIVDYRHLRQACTACCEQAGIDLAERHRAGEALLEVYTCYPVVPIAFLLQSGLVSTLAELPGWLAHHPVTVTGGMNLARAPWNNPALNGLISMVAAMTEGGQPWGVVHGNGGLGYRQGVALLRHGGRA